MEGGVVVECIATVVAWMRANRPVITVGAAIVTAGATIAYVLVAIGQLKAIRRLARVAARQLRAMNRQADIVERNVISLERPWVLVTVDTPGPGRPDKQNLTFPTPIAAMVHATNYGRTPAFILRRSYALRVFPEGLPVDPPYPEELVYNSGPDITGLGVAVNGSHSESIGFNLTEEDWRLLAARKATLVCFGKIIHRDLWKKDHITRFLRGWTVIDSQPNRSEWS
jgi:hypothetical protein